MRKQRLKKNAPLFMFLGITALVALAAGCVVDDPDFRPNSKDAIIASKKHVVVTPLPANSGSNK